MTLKIEDAGPPPRRLFAGKASADCAEKTAEPRVNPRLGRSEIRRLVRRVRIVRISAGAVLTAGCAADAPERRAP